jgi:hypothetical protein
MRFCISARGTANSFSTLAVKSRNSFDERAFAMRISSVTLLLLLTCGLSAQSQPPSPSGGAKEQRPATQQAEPTQTQPEPRERGTEIDPLVVRPIRSQDQAEEDRADRLDQQASRRQAFWLSAVTVIVLGFQVWLLTRQNTIIGKQTDIMTEQRDAANAQSEHMSKALVETRKAADAAKQSADTAERALVLLNRPYLDAENWRGDIIGAMKAETMHITVSFNIVNSSVTPAFVESIEVNDDSGQASPLGELSTDTTVEATIGPRQSQPFRRDVLLTQEQWQQVYFGKLAVNFWGTITFTDDFILKGHKRVRHFSRVGVFWCVEGSLDGFLSDFHTPVGLGFSGKGNRDEEVSEEDEGQSKDQP